MVGCTTLVRTLSMLISTAVIIRVATGQPSPVTPPTETPAEHDARMAWWRDARLGMFIHWGLYAVPAGAWKDKTNHGEWIRHSGQIPIEEYEKFLGQFNPVKFNADDWVRMAKDAG